MPDCSKVRKGNYMHADLHACKAGTPSPCRWPAPSNLHTHSLMAPCTPSCHFPCSYMCTTLVPSSVTVAPALPSSSVPGVQHHQPVSRSPCTLTAGPYPGGTGQPAGSYSIHCLSPSHCMRPESCTQQYIHISMQPALTNNAVFCSKTGYLQRNEKTTREQAAVFLLPLLRVPTTQGNTCHVCHTHRPHHAYSGPGCNPA